MWLCIAIAVLLADYALAFAIVRLVRQRPGQLVAPIALAVIVCFESVVLTALSALQAITRDGVLVAHLVPVIIALAASPRRVGDYVRSVPGALSKALARLGTPGVFVLPLFVLLVLSAVRYAPNTWDSMTYHLARVAHWVQNRSVAPYPTNISRQVLLGPGAEYLLLVLQVVSGSDRLANFLQLFCWTVVVVAAPSLARIAGAPLVVSRWASPFVAGLPMLVLQATSTQNDLVAAVLTVAILAASTPFLHASGRRWRLADVVLLGISGAASLLVKPLAIIAALPVILLAASGAAAAVLDGSRGRVRALSALAGGAALSLPLALGSLRTSLDAAAGRVQILAGYLFPVWGDWGERGVNIILGLMHHAVLPRSLASAIGVDVTQSCGTHPICFAVVLMPHEDVVGNPAHAGVIALLLAVSAFSWTRLRPRVRASLVALTASWIVFHLFVRENAWVSRLQTPLFAWSVVALAALGGAHRSRPRCVERTLGAAVLALLAHGLLVAGMNISRRPFGGITSRDDTYYSNRPDLKKSHDSVLHLLNSTNCDRLGLYIGGDSWDYPLTWRAMQRGVTVRHVVGPDAWPCVVFTDRGPPPHSDTAVWTATSDPEVFVRSLNAGG
ncbi:hypothetical protein [Anaeromyxobacter sp. Fw109-5]|uniref:hypothetical protein n=1 Tax=Anaeromyxobacter sp. (strain Fw109-5) TaxID=404589 RepID=UPI0000ED81EA|nr:hypothetical protein [Anaeromyxobacter sp. Fw109-5]ABS26015.1 hypothetical protein Anae109_1812 [Anaeromyxobacter sp. Fw109-5]